jgi:hypothetical protein
VVPYTYRTTRCARGRPRHGCRHILHAAEHTTRAHARAKTKEQLNDIPRSWGRLQLNTHCQEVPQHNAGTQTALKTKPSLHHTESPTYMKSHLFAVSTPPVSYQSVHVSSTQGNRPYVPSHPDAQAEQAEALVLPATENGVAAGHTVHGEAPLGLYLPAGQTIAVAPGPGSRKRSDPKTQ